MYDSYIFLSQPNYLYNYFEDGGYELKTLDKANWLNYITNHEFAPDTAINALDAAVGEVKATVGDPDYRANVFMTLFYPVIRVREFGEVDGKMLDLADMADRKAALKWMVDESVRQFNGKNYQNVRLARFYWYCEEMNFMDTDKGLTGYITDYIRSLDMKTCWCPFFGAPGHEIWKELGFDIATHQANYFPEHRKNRTNCGTEERFPLVAQSVEKYGLGVGMEMSDSEEESVDVFKEYLKVGVEYGFMHKPHIYYLGRGPKVVNEIHRAADPYVHSVYDELYQYIHRTLEVSDIKHKE